MKFAMAIMSGFMRRAAIKWIDVYVMGVYFYVLLRNFLEGFKKDQIRNFLEFEYDDNVYYKYYEVIESTRTNVGTRKLPLMKNVTQCFRAN